MHTNDPRVPLPNEEATMNPVVHFAMPYDDHASMSAFCEQAFGWQTQALGEAMGNCVLATMTETGKGQVLSCHIQTV